MIGPIHLLLGHLHTQDLKFHTFGVAVKSFKRFLLLLEPAEASKVLEDRSVAAEIEQAILDECNCVPVNSHCLLKTGGILQRKTVSFQNFGKTDLLFQRGTTKPL